MPKLTMPRHLLVTMFVCVTVTIAGCGSGSATDSHPFALATSVCRTYDAYIKAQLLPEGVLAHKTAELAKLRAAMSAARSQPRVRVFISDLASLESFYTAIKDKRPLPRYFAARGRLFQSAVRVNADAKALGLTACVTKLRKPIGG